MSAVTFSDDSVVNGPIILRPQFGQNTDVNSARNSHGDDLYGDLKHIRNALDQVLASARFAARVRDDARQLDVLATTHRLLHARQATRVASRDSGQLDLF